MILFQATGKSNAMPSWLEGWKPRSGVELDRHDRRDGTLWSIKADWEKVPTDIDELEWIAIDGCEWKVVVIGSWHSWWFDRQRSDLRYSIVSDVEEREWNVINVLTLYPSDKPRFNIPRGKNWEPLPETWQERLINAARWIREEVVQALSDDDCETMDLDEEQPMNEEVYCVSFDPVKILQGAAECLCTTYHLTTPLIQAIGLLDDYFAGSIMREMAGFRQESMIEVAKTLDV